MTSAAPAPWTARAAMSQPTPGARAQAADVAANSARPPANMRRRPKRSPSAAAGSSSTASVRLYELTVHSSSSIDAPRSSRIVVRAVDTTRVSSATISEATEVSARIQPFVDLLFMWGQTAAAAETDRLLGGELVREAERGEQLFVQERRDRGDAGPL